MDIFAISQLRAQQERVGHRYLEFLRVPSMSLGLYVLPAGAVDTQQPHAEDEVYYVVSGKGRIQVGDEDQAVEPGAILFVKVNAPHRFHTVTEELNLLVFFAPAEGSSTA